MKPLKVNMRHALLFMFDVAEKPWWTKYVKSRLPGARQMLFFPQSFFSVHDLVGNGLSLSNQLTHHNIQHDTQY